MGRGEVDNSMLDDYGLAENPFSLPTPPNPSSRKWLFVDRSLKEDISSSPTLEKVINKFITRIKNNQGGNRGLMIIGAWGAGKSHSLFRIEEESLRQGLQPLTMDVVNNQELITSAFSKYEGDLFKSFAEVIAEKKNIQYTSFEDLLKKISPDGVIITVDKSEDLPRDFGIDRYISFMRSISNLVERLAQQELNIGIVFGMNPEPYGYLKERALYVLDRFDKAWISDDISYLEAYEIIENNLSTVRSNKPTFSNGDKLIYPFSGKSIHKILDVWRKEIRTIRHFRENCAKVLDYASENGLNIISDVDAATAIHSQYNDWEKSLIEWRGLQFKKRVLTYALYNVLDFCKNSSEIKYSDIAVDVPHPVVIDDTTETVKIDLAVVLPNNLPIAIEIETGYSFSSKKYIKIGKLIEQGEFAGVVLITLSYKGLVRANKVLFSKIKDPNRFRALKLENDVLIIGRILSFGAFTPDLGFPRIEDFRSEIKNKIKIDDAVQAINYSGIQSAIESISGSVR